MTYSIIQVRNQENHLQLPVTVRPSISGWGYILTTYSRSSRCWIALHIWSWSSMSLNWVGCLLHQNPREKPRESPTALHAALTRTFLARPQEKRQKIVGVLNRFHSHVMRVIRSDEDTPTGTIVFTIAIVMMGDSCHGRVSQVSRIRDNHPLWTTSGGMTLRVASPGTSGLVLQRRGGGGQVCGWDWWCQDNCNSKSWRRRRLIRITSTPEYIISSSGSGTSYLY